ncbi:uncharacterized protein LOC105664767 [Ceratitis capitata]|uniref:uncharacterized protein LOC105664767 n=1 Tax=Ceratitis capitata TaxID=7213 RepID=UPI000A11CCB5|nr:uncharacterized protein LOC105664767 [Ceratitis capitata]
MQYSLYIFVLIFCTLHVFHGTEAKEIFFKALSDNEVLNSTKLFVCKKADDVIPDGKENLQTISTVLLKRVPRSLSKPLIVEISKTKVENQILEPKLPDIKPRDLVSFDAQFKPLSMSNSAGLNQQSILASVRQTNQLVQQKQQIHPTKERQKTRIMHTVIMNRASEHSTFQQGSNYKVHVEDWQRSRVRREISDKGEDHLKSSDTLKKANFNIHKGILLLIHLDNLLKNANIYLPEEENSSSSNINYSNTDNEKEIINCVYNNTKSSPKHYILMDTRKYLIMLYIYQRNVFH